MKTAIILLTLILALPLTTAATLQEQARTTQAQEKPRQVIKTIDGKSEVRETRTINTYTFYQTTSTATGIISLTILPE